MDFQKYLSLKHSALCECGKIFDCTNLEFTLRSTSKLLFSSYYYDPRLHTISIIILSKQLQ